MRRFLAILACFFFTVSLCADPLTMRITSDSDPQSTVAGCINALSGEFFCVERDIESKRAGGLNYSRVYDSASRKPNVMGYGWGNNFAKKLMYFKGKKKMSGVGVGSCEYDQFAFATKETQKGKFFGDVLDDLFKIGYINSPEALMMGTPSFSRTTVSCILEEQSKEKKIWEVKLPDGTLRTYNKTKFKEKYSDGKLYWYRLTEEHLPNGHIRYYDYVEDSTKLEKIRVTNSDASRELDSLTFTYGKKKQKYEKEIRSASGEVVHYRVSPVCIDVRNFGTVVFSLSDVTASHLQDSKFQKKYFKNEPQSEEPSEDVPEYHFKISKVLKPQSRALYLSYYEETEESSYGKIKALKVPLGEGGKPTSIYTFKYYYNQTDVFDPFDNKTSYYRVNNRLDKIKQGDYRAFKYYWDGKGNLLNKGLQTIDGRSVRCTYYRYNSIGNLVEKTVSGNITGNGPDRFNLDGKGLPIGNVDRATHKFAYSIDGMNLKTKEFLPNGTCYEYHYKPKTNLLIKRLTFSEGKFRQRVFNTYDENSLLVKTIEDDGAGKFDSLDGVTYRLITEIQPELNENANGYTQSKRITESYFDLETGTQKLLKRTEFVYNQADLVSEKSIYDQNMVHRYTLFYEYNPHGKVIRELNAHGGETRYRYDDNDNLIYQEIAGSKKKTFFKYDLLNRLVGETEVCTDGVVLTTTYTYDLLGNRLSTTDPYGSVTRYTYDAYSREVSRTDPLGNVTFTEYDLLDNPIKITDKEGHTTLKKYTVDGKPFEIQYPDGTEEKLVYFTNGNLHKKWNRDGTQIAYLYDYLDRITCETRYDQNGNVINQDKYKYKGKNLICHTDAMGIDTHYVYDCAGRLKTEMREGIEESYFYDSLGREWKTIKGDRVKIKGYDLRGRVTEERVEDLNGNIYTKETSIHDAVGNKVTSRIYTSESVFSETRTEFNGKNLPVTITDPEGNETRYLYTHNGHFQRTVIDPLGKETREVYDRLNRFATREITHSGLLLAREDVFYSPSGNKVRQVNYVVESGKMSGSSTLEWTYDPSGNVLSQIEQGTKVTDYSYAKGRLSTTMKPDGVILTQTYDSLGRVASLTSSDGTIRYAYQYDLNNNLLNATDLNSNHSIERSYDSHNRLIRDKQATDIEFSYSYDMHNRLQECIWQDNKIVYEYSPFALLSASRHKNNQELYRYLQTVDWRGKTLTSTLPNGTTIDYNWDPVGRCSRIDSALFQQDLFYDQVGNLIATTLKDDHTTFSYDHLYQLTDESGKFSNQYTFDSLNNRRSKNEIPNTIDDFNQLIHDSRHLYQYDENGNRTAKGNSHYSYDALGRLTSFADENNQVTYRYDPLGRCYEKQDFDKTVQYIHQFDTEIGVVENGKTKELRTIHGQFSSFAFELGDSVYFPIRNHRGDTCLLLDRQGEPVSTYHYDVFGEFIYEGSITSPWLFSGQRYDSSTELYTYSKRNYDPSIGRWLTPDPIGFADGPNLYAYVHNNPLIYVDPYGLWGESLGNWYNNSKQFFGAFTRGAVDDTTFGASSYMLGQYDTSSFAAKSGYYTGTACSMAAGLFYGATWLKGGRAAINGCKYARNAYMATKTTKNVLEARKVVKLTSDSGVIAKNVFNTFRNSSGIALKSEAKESAKMLFNSWDKGTFPNRMQSIRYHFQKHANGRTVTEYTNDAMSFFKKNKSSAREIILKNGQEGFSIKMKHDGTRMGGFWTKNEKIITYWD